MTAAQTKAVKSEARKDAKLIVEADPRVDASKLGDWDSVAWAMAPQEIQVIDGAWDLYRATLRTEIARLTKDA